MKRLFVVFLAASCVLSSCNLFKEKDYSEEEKAIAEAKNEAITAINDAKTSAVSDAQESIRSVITNAVEGASEDISSTIKDAKNEIQASAEKSVNQTLNEKLAEFQSDLAKAHRNAAIAALIGAVSLILAIVLLVLLMIRTNLKGKTKRDEVIEIVAGSKRIKDLINTAIDVQYNKEIKPFIRQGTNKSVIETEIKRYLGNPANRQFIVSLLAKQEDDSKLATHSGKDTEGAGQQGTAPIQSKVELYAKDSPDNVLSGVTPSYVQGKSIYRLILNTQDAQVAEITVCTDKEDVKSRILKSSNDLLEPVCRVDRKRSDPGELSSISIRSGKAEKQSSDTWKVIEPIIVELS